MEPYRHKPHTADIHEVPRVLPPSTPPVYSSTLPSSTPNIYPNGKVCLSILDADAHWNANFSVIDILVSVRELLDNPNVGSPAQAEAYLMYTTDREAYEDKVKAFCTEGDAENVMPN